MEYIQSADISSQLNTDQGGKFAQVAQEFATLCRMSDRQRASQNKQYE